jgi:hypothetical protein
MGMILVKVLTGLFIRFNISVMIRLILMEL